MTSSDRIATRPSGRVAFVGLLVLLAWAPIPLGSNRPWSWALLEAGVFTLVAVWCISFVRSPAPLPPGLRAARWPLIFLTAWIAYLFAQLAPVPLAWLEALNPATATAYRSLEAVEIPLVAAFTVDRAATAEAAIKLAAYVGAFFLVVSLCDSVARLRWLQSAILIIGTVEALYALEFHALAGPETEQGIVGTYVNRNHLAGLLEMTISVAIGLCLAHASRIPRQPGSRGLVIWLTSFLLGRGGWMLFALLVMMCALVFTTSRGGIIALGAALAIVLGFSAIAKNRDLGERRTLPLLAGVIFFGLMWFGLGGLPDKLDRAGLDGGRADLREVGYQMIADRPLFGSGAGTFRWVFPQYKDARFSLGYYEHAHNDYIELLTDQGVVGAVLAMGAIGSAGVCIVIGFRVRRRARIRAALIASSVGTLSLMIHGLVDFNFHIPANATYFFVLLGLGVASASVSDDQRGPASPVEPGARPWRIS